MTTLAHYKPLMMIVYKTFDGSYKVYAIEEDKIESFREAVNSNKVVTISGDGAVLVTRNIVDFVRPKTEVEKFVYMQGEGCRNRLLDIEAIDQAKDQKDPIERLKRRIDYFNENLLGRY